MSIKKLLTKEYWGVETNLQVLLILVAFSLAGSMAVHIAGPITHYIGFDHDTTSPWVFWPIRIALIFPLYQISLLIIGTLLGQGPFFRRYAKKMLRRHTFK